MKVNAVFCAVDVVMTTVDDLPPLTIEEIGIEQRLDAKLTIVRTRIETAATSAPPELEGYASASGTYAAMRKHFPSR